MPDLRQYIARKIKEFREAARLSQTALAQRLAVTPNTVSRWESGVYQPRIEDLDKLSREFDKPIWAFFPAEVQPPTTKHEALLSATGDLPPEDIDEVVRFVGFIRAGRAIRNKKKATK